MGDLGIPNRVQSSSRLCFITVVELTLYISYQPSWMISRLPIIRVAVQGALYSIVYHCRCLENLDAPASFLSIATQADPLRLLHRNYWNYNLNYTNFAESWLLTTFTLICRPPLHFRIRWTLPSRYFGIAQRALATVKVTFSGCLQDVGKSIGSH